MHTSLRLYFNFSLPSSCARCVQKAIEAEFKQSFSISTKELLPDQNVIILFYSFCINTFFNAPTGFCCPELDSNDALATLVASNIIRHHFNQIKKRQVPTRNVSDMHIWCSRQKQFFNGSLCICLSFSLCFRIIK